MWSYFHLPNTLSVCVIALISTLLFTITNHCTWKSCLITAASLCWTRVVTRGTACYQPQYFTGTKLQWVLLIPEQVYSQPGSFANHFHMGPYLASLHQGYICYQVQVCKCACFMFSNASFVGVNDVNTGIVLLQLHTLNSWP